MTKYEDLKSVVDAENGITYLVNKHTNEIESYADRFGNIFNKKNELVAIAS